MARWCSRTRKRQDGAGSDETWFSPPGINLYASLVIRTTLDTQRLSQWLSWLPLMTALGTAEAIESAGAARVSLKWPNDLLIGDRKVGGILCESGASIRTGPFQVIGIGINVNGERASFPRGLRDVATSIRQETGREVDRHRLLVRLLEELELCLEEFLTRGIDRLAVEYRRRCTTLGKTVKAVLADGNEYVGTAEGIGDDGSLDNGSRATAAWRPVRSPAAACRGYYTPPMKLWVAKPRPSP